jgi:cytochrome c nitrite reductase small subunit
MFKALDGLKHSYMFTTRSEHQAIRIGAMGSAVVQKNCISCHNQKILAHDNLFNQKQIDNKTEVRCWTCHKSTPHGETRSLSTTYRNINPNKIKNEPLVPEWIKEELKKESERKDETK